MQQKIQIFLAALLQVLYKVGVELIDRIIPKYDKVIKAWDILTSDDEVEAYLEMANIFAVKRLHYNDHGPVHSRIVAGSAMAIYQVLLARGFTPSVVRDGVGDVEDSLVVTLMGAYLHDIGNGVHRTLHPVYSALLADRLTMKILGKLYGLGKRAYMLKQEVMHAVFCHDEAYTCLTFEGAVAKVADGTDMAEGRARAPYEEGKNDIHALSALAIREVYVGPGEKRPLAIHVHMDDEAGIFQVDEVLGKKIATSGLAPHVEVKTFVRGAPWVTRTFETTWSLPNLA
ncbi:MAG: phosphohydrolase [Thermoproteus sp. AZ2]|jgi:metal-dependent HD superfamily phosphatase/phosphodiesterase|uniref:Phosphohydrolase n=1 Tax=Thermoproteus sp. AZ2 TaxID=1609232 RepID=A0ACC6V091_9CREN|nr:MAG: phosphohydrolase [Thermoproteus sp. AZ2]